jgi:TPR repeat protein
MEAKLKSKADAPVSTEFETWLATTLPYHPREQLEHFVQNGASSSSSESQSSSSYTSAADDSKQPAAPSLSDASLAQYLEALAAFEEGDDIAVFKKVSTLIPAIPFAFLRGVEMEELELDENRRWFGNASPDPLHGDMQQSTWINGDQRNETKKSAKHGSGSLHDLHSISRNTVISALRAFSESANIPMQEVMRMLGGGQDDEQLLDFVGAHLRASMAENAHAHNPNANDNVPNVADGGDDDTDMGLVSDFEPVVVDLVDAAADDDNDDDVFTDTFLDPPSSSSMDSVVIDCLPTRPAVRCIADATSIGAAFTELKHPPLPAFAYYMLGRSLFFGARGSCMFNRREAYKLLSIGALVHREPWCQILLAISLHEGRGALVDRTLAYSLAAPLVRKFAELAQKPQLMFSDVEAVFLSAWCFELGCGVRREPVEAVRLYKVAAEYEHPSAMTHLALCYDTAIGTEAKKDEAAELNRRALAMNYGPAIYNYGVTYEFGDGLPKDSKRALQLYERASKLEYSGALHARGISMENGGSNGMDQPPTDLYQVFHMYRRASRDLYGPALAALANCMCYGRGCEMDWKRAQQYLNLAIHQRCADGLTSYGIVFMYGNHVPIDGKKGLEYFERAHKEFDYEHARRLMAYFLENGIGCDRDSARAQFYRSFSARKTFAMGTRPRLGENSAVYRISKNRIYDKNVLRIVFSYIGGADEDTELLGPDAAASDEDLAQVAVAADAEPGADETGNSDNGGDGADDDDSVQPLDADISGGEEDNLH